MTQPLTTSPHPYPRRWKILGLLGVAQLMLILDVTVVAVALPNISADLGLGRQALTWVVSGYTLAFGGLLLLGGRAADLFGARRLVVVGLVAFAGASLLEHGDVLPGLLARDARRRAGGPVPDQVYRPLLSASSKSRLLAPLVRFAVVRERRSSTVDARLPISQVIVVVLPARGRAVVELGVRIVGLAVSAVRVSEAAKDAIALSSVAVCLDDCCSGSCHDDPLS